MNPPVPISDSYIGPGSTGNGTSASPWPRRASRACASCRRDKIRCDGARPCNACVKKGYLGYQCTVGCEPCRKARSRCEESNDKPCNRCRKMNLQCVDAPLAPSMAFPNAQIQNGAIHDGSPTYGLVGNPDGTTDQFVTNLPDFLGTSTMALDQMPANDSPGKSVHGTERAKLACAGCRRDNKKCDDQRPCSRCISRSEECIHVTRGPKLVKLRCEGCREDNKKCEESKPCKYCLESVRECVNVPRRGRARVKSACVSCRRDKIRCNGDRPCASCVKKGCECVERACGSCIRQGKGSECTHRRSADSAGSPASDTPLSSNSKVAAPTTMKDDRSFVPSQDDFRWMAFSTPSTAQAPPILPPNAIFSGQQQHAVFPSANGYPDSGISNNQVLTLHPHITTMMHATQIYGRSSPNVAPYFFDSLDPGLSNNYQLVQHMTPTSNSRTYLPSD